MGKLKPRTTDEFYIAAIADMDVPIPEPRTRNQVWMKAMLEQQRRSWAETTERSTDRIASLDESELVGKNVVDTVGIPAYVEDAAQYSDFGITETGWYVFARIQTREGVTVSAQTTVTGAAGYVAEAGADHIDLAVRFDVAAQSQKVVINWGDYAETFVFKATDLAIRNLDYRTTFYVYDIAPFARWEYALTADETFQAGKKYYTRDNDTYTLAEVQTVSYSLTADETFQANKTYYTRDNDTYTAATVTAGESIPPDTYYEAGTVPVPADTYYVHSKLIFEGMARNITYMFNEIVDCPQEYHLPEIEDDTHGCWYEIRLRHDGSYSSTLVVPDGVTVASEHTQAETAGLNMVDLHYSDVGGLKIWRFMNTHASIPSS